MLKHLLLTLAAAGTSLAALAQQGPGFATAGKAGVAVQATGARALPSRGASFLAPMSLSGNTFSAASPIVRNLQDAGTYKHLVLAAERAYLVDVLQQAGPHTVFAPNDDAFGQLPAGLLDDLSRPHNRARLHALIGTHIVPGDLKEQDLTPGRVLTTVAGTTLTVRRSGGRVALEDQFGKRAYLTVTNQPASNGTVHTLANVLGLP
ncbi:fasciclin domain-containing protein [Hymenobacter edaphi]|uniref:Fasciclin domain-containing protein n=1 Tax=Hymenobacter edaphi TaxID=2211146 RepID=A0A328BNR3_9BACT|nr:fasciclin domain-containing protein [Hymenobacter edaphi]RAK68249.1 fasciclin domain-containing protein [Hymenobacter edaphi]